MPPAPAPHALATERLIAASPSQVFAAFARPELLARWWGPAGFTNTFSHFDFTPGGRWVFVMHAPDGADFANESVFREIVPDTRLVIEHVVAPWFRLTVTLDAHEKGTRLSWVQEFESPEFAARMRAFVTSANEQVLDRLAALPFDQSA